MRRSMLLVVLASLVFIVPSLAEAGIVARINISSQRMNVYVDGMPRYTWLVSTARPPYRTPVGTFRPTGVFRYHASTIYSGSPMPYSIFFLRGYAIHGSYETRYLGRPASHGCVRLHPANAAVLYSLVRQYGLGNMLIEISY
jgi:lipoprotein-anchoring transpeptidase ErfK/SrfK